MPRIVVLTLEAKKGSYFEPDAFARSIGKRFPVRGQDSVERSKATLRKAVVHPDGKAVDLTIEMDT